jgi:TolB-like protein/class 3 adenylate cyclase
MSTRRLAAILAADVVGYSRLMGADEEGTLERLKTHRRELIDPKIAEHHGRIVKTTGDGMLVEFASAVDAARCAVEVQRDMAERSVGLPQDKRIEIRIGIHVGDIIIDGDDIFGDGVNIAARLEGIAEPGGVTISGAAHEQVRDRLPYAFEDGGEQSMKNIARPVRVYRVRADGSASASPIARPPPADVPLTLPDKPSIAVLPFQNMSGDPEQEYFADGIAEDIITALSRFKSLFVIARNSSFTYKGKAVDIRKVGRELGVRYVLEGSVRKAANRLRITGQLVESETGVHLWANRFDGAFEEVFDLQDRVTASVVGAIAPKLDQIEIDRAKRKPVENLDAYDCVLRGMGKMYELQPDTWREAYQFFSRAIQLDPGFATPYALAARYFTVRKNSGLVDDKAQDEAEVKRLASRVSAIGHDDAFALCWAGHSLLFVCGDLEGGAAMIDQALSINPNLAACWQTRGSASVYQGQHETAITELERALRLNPVGPDSYHIEQNMAAAYMFLGRYDQAQEWCTRVLTHLPTHFPNAVLGMQVSAVAYVLSGKIDEGRKVMTAIRHLRPKMSIANQKDIHPLRRPEDRARLLDGLRIAGLPE